jgi:glycoprotein-N-acetylgalactosamine 3-beta-galactosyltransferase
MMILQRFVRTKSSRIRVSAVLVLVVCLQVLFFATLQFNPASGPNPVPSKPDFTGSSVMVSLKTSRNNFTLVTQSVLTPKVDRKTEAKERLSEATAKRIQKNCLRNHKVMDQIQVAERRSSPKILCFLMTHSENHATRVAAVRKTWGKRCDKLVIASNSSDPTIEAIHMKSEATYTGLWEKLNETMNYLWEQYRQDDYEWIYKADDDTYLIAENLRQFLSSPAVQNKSNHNLPLVYGRLYSSPRYRNLEKRKVYFGNPLNADFGRRFYTKVDRNAPVIYNYGGSGYAMNWRYVEKFRQAMRGPDTLHGTPPEDQGHGVVMAFHGIMPQYTRDDLGRERFHPEAPKFMYDMSEEMAKNWKDNHKATGGLSTGPDCCSEKSIAFHHLTPMEMMILDDTFYSCRQRD